MYSVAHYFVFLRQRPLQGSRRAIRSSKPRAPHSLPHISYSHCTRLIRWASPHHPPSMYCTLYCYRTNATLYIGYRSRPCSRSAGL